jgi:transposase-like protein
MRDTTSAMMTESSESHFENPENKVCPKCQSAHYVRHGIVKGRQRYACKICGYNFTVFKLGKRLEQTYIDKALELRAKGLSLRATERIVGVSYVTVRNWVNLYGKKSPPSND